MLLLILVIRRPDDVHKSDLNALTNNNIMWLSVFVKVHFFLFIISVQNGRFIKQP